MLLSVFAFMLLVWTKCNFKRERANVYKQEQMMMQQMLYHSAMVADLSLILCI